MENTSAVLVYQRRHHNYNKVAQHNGLHRRETACIAKSKQHDHKVCNFGATQLAVKDWETAGRQLLNHTAMRACPVCTGAFFKKVHILIEIKAVARS